MVRVVFQSVFLAVVFSLGLLSELEALPKGRYDCPTSLKSIFHAQLWRERSKLGGKPARGTVIRFTSQMRTNTLDLQKANEEVAVWIDEFLRYRERLESFPAGLRRLRKRIEILESLLKADAPKSAEPFEEVLLPPAPDKIGGVIVVPQNPAFVSRLVKDKRALKRLIKEEMLEQKKFESALRDLREQQAIYFVRFSIILKLWNESPESSNRTEHHPITKQRLELIKDIEDLLDPRGVFVEYHPDPEIFAWAQNLYRYDQIFREFRRRYHIEDPLNAMNWVNQRAKDFVKLHSEKLAWVGAITTVLGTYGFFQNQLRAIQEQTSEIRNQLVETVKSPEELKREKEEREKSEREKQLIADAKMIAEKSESWDEMETRFAQFMSRFPAESGIIWGQVKNGKRKDFAPDASFHPFFFEQARQIELWWTRIQEGYALNGEQLIYGAKGRFDVRRESRDLLRQFLDKMEFSSKAGDKPQ